MIQQLNIDLVLEFRIHKYFFKDENRLTLDKAKDDLNTFCNLNLYDFSEDNEYIKFTLKEKLIKEHFSLFLLRQCFFMLNNERFSECISIHLLSSFEEKLESVKKGNYKYIRYNPCLYIVNAMLKDWYTYEVEFSSITFGDSNGDFILEGLRDFRKYLKSLIKRRYPQLGDAVYLNCLYIDELKDK